MGVVVSHEWWLANAPAVVASAVAGILIVFAVLVLIIMAVVAVPHGVHVLVRGALERHRSVRHP